MNEFEWRRQLRDLRQPQAPRRDLWEGIERALDTAPADLRAVATGRRRDRGSRAPWLLAAGLAAMTILAVGISQHPLMTNTTSAGLASTSPWKPDDPRLAGAAVELTAAQFELRQAMQQAPDSPALQRLLDRTEQQESRLRRLGHDAG